MLFTLVDISVSIINFVALEPNLFHCPIIILFRLHGKSTTAQVLRSIFSASCCNFLKLYSCAFSGFCSQTNCTLFVLKESQNEKKIVYLHVLHCQTFVHDKEVHVEQKFLTLKRQNPACHSLLLNPHFHWQHWEKRP